MGFRIVNAIVYYIVWVYAVYCGAAKETLIPLKLTLAVFFLHLGYLYFKDRKMCYIDFFLVLGMLGLGILAEMLFHSAGWLSYPTENKWFSFIPSAWVLSLYVLMAVTMNHSFSFLGKHLGMAFILGTAFSPFGYLFAQRLGAVSISSTPSFAGIALTWGVLLCLSVYINRKLTTFFSS